MKYLLSLLLIVGLIGQTKKGTSPTPTTPGYCLTLYINGNPTCLTLDPSVVLIWGLNNRSATIKVVATTGLNIITNEFYIAIAGQTAFTVANTPATGTLMVFRNGIHQTPTMDYTLSGNIVTFLAAVPFVASEIVLFDYAH
jgi:hypothetical protein